jgi:hypothetical protein
MIKKIYHVNSSPQRPLLFQNYPDPFQLVTTIGYQLAELCHVILKIYDSFGREVEVLVNERQNPGIYRITFDASKLPQGVYHYRLYAGKFVAEKAMVLIK